MSGRDSKTSGLTRIGALESLKDRAMRAKPVTKYEDGFLSTAVEAQSQPCDISSRLAKETQRTNWVT